MFGTSTHTTENVPPAMAEGFSSRQEPPRKQWIASPAAWIPDRSPTQANSIPTSIRWVRRILVVLILLCLALAGWVWVDIFLGLP